MLSKYVTIDYGMIKEFTIMENNQFDDILQQYRLIWNHRTLNQGLSSEAILKDAITRELKDENSHPRVRRTSYEKFYSAVKRIEQSSISNKIKLQLLGLHIELMEEQIKG